MRRLPGRLYVSAGGLLIAQLAARLGPVDEVLDEITQLGGTQLGRAHRVNLTADQVAWVLYALRDLVARRRLGGQPIPKQLVELHNHLTASAYGSENDTAPEELPVDDLIDTKSAAEILECSPRWVTEIHADLDGKKIGRHWVFRRQTVADYAVAKGVSSGSDRVSTNGCGAVPPRAA